MSYISVALGGAIGSLGRYEISLIPVKSQFPIIPLLQFFLACGAKKKYRLACYNIPMTYDNITKAIFISRPNRFIAKVRLFDNQEENATEETVHVKNTGRCKELLIPGCTVYLEKSNNPNRKTLYDLIAVWKKKTEERGEFRKIWITI